MNKYKLDVITLATGIFLSLYVVEAGAVKSVYASGYREPIAVRGYDVVAYFTDEAPKKGKKEYSFKYKDVTWLFSSKDNLETFMSNPMRYEPQYGGYCAYAVAKTSTAASKPQYFTIHNDKLYLNFSEDVNRKWLKNKEFYIQRADKSWPQVLDGK